MRKAPLGTPPACGFPFTFTDVRADQAGILRAIPNSPGRDVSTVNRLVAAYGY
jgi:hypothetical protein